MNHVLHEWAEGMEILDITTDVGAERLLDVVTYIELAFDISNIIRHSGEAQVRDLAGAIHTFANLDFDTEVSR